MKKGLFQNLISGLIALFILLEYFSDALNIFSGNYFGKIVDGWGDSMIMIIFALILGINLFSYRKQKDKSLFKGMLMFSILLLLSIPLGNKIKLPVIFFSSLFYLIFLLGIFWKNRFSQS
ncbi:hypothetical protein I5M27_12210 [Adhaeribacter sp. BT258]|uniref:Uncharacterized protein n=1 Tax=Adhaeribacter terrigena TaxID=2793070 RepID=A0ABS1C341_9BACT|nr:hypothetical protein [Adhaeribacter terrigena]MBK0403755.1 hypothetical protein [Adhaeribacter terrigena]